MENDFSKGYSICYNEWALDKDIKNELGLLLIISSLSMKEGYCFASNEYLAKIYQETTISISRKIKKLEEKGYLKIVYHKEGFRVEKRELRLTRLLTGDYQNGLSPINQIVKENIISINNININKRESGERKFAPPTLNDILIYIKEKDLKVNGKQFFDYFEAGNWKDKNGNKVLNWKQKLLTWNQFEKEKTKSENNEVDDDKRWELFEQRLEREGKLV